MKPANNTALHASVDAWAKFVDSLLDLSEADCEYMYSVMGDEINACSLNLICKKRGANV